MNYTPVGGPLRIPKVPWELYNAETVAPEGNRESHIRAWQGIPLMKPAVRRALWFVALLIGVAAVIFLFLLWPTGSRLAVTISPETTYITEPLREDGYPDYVAALNQRASEGVTPENNAAVLFWKAMGPGEIDVKDRQQYFNMLGIAPLPEKETTSSSLAGTSSGLRRPGARASGPTADGIDPHHKQLGSAMKRPWSRTSSPALAGWLDVNAKPLARMVEASSGPAATIR